MLRVRGGSCGWQQGGPAIKEFRGQAIAVVQPAQLPLRQQQCQTVGPCPDRYGHIEAGAARILANRLEVPDAAVQLLEGIRGGRGLLDGGVWGVRGRSVRSRNAEHQSVVVGSPLCELEIGISEPMECRARIRGCLTGPAKVAEEFLESVLANRSQQFFPSGEVVVGGLVRHTKSAGEVTHGEIKLPTRHHLQSGPNAGRTKVTMMVSSRGAS